MARSSAPDAASGLVECVPNVSEGRRLDVVRRIAEGARSAKGAFLLDVQSDYDHHRSVLTIVGTPDAVAEAAFRVADAAVHAIDLRTHRGTHPRIGALDVLPFVPLGSTPMSTCVALAQEVGRRIAESLGVPVYFYGEAATRPERRLLANIRRGQYEGLREAIGLDPSRQPDLGPAAVGPAGATAVGARPVLVAFNVHLRTDDVGVAQSIARALRQSNGGLPGVQALGLRTSRPGIVQVSMNVTDLGATPVHVVMARLREQAQARRVDLAESDLVGLMPMSSVLGAACASLGLLSLGRTKVIDLALEDAMSGSGVD